MEFKLNDVYKFTWKKEYREKIDPYHCFEGKLIMLQNKDGNYILADTFWGIGDITGKKFTVEETLEKGELTYYCNLDEIEEINEYDVDYYDDNDLFYLSRQHGCVRGVDITIKEKVRKNHLLKLKKS